VEIKKAERRKAKKIMPRSTIIFILVLTILASILGYNYFIQPFANLKSTVIEQTESTIGGNKKTDLNLKSDNQFTIEQQLAQLIAFPYSLDINESTQSAMLSWIEEYQPGAVTLFGEKVSTSAAKFTIGQINSGFDSDLSPLIVVDHEGGSVQRFSGVGFTDLPSWKSICSTDSTQRQNLLTTSAQELSQVGVEVVFAPVIDVASQSAILKDRVCSPDPTIVTKRAIEFIDIFSQQKILSVIKHFPGIGSISTDLHHNYDEVNVSEEEILVFKDLLDTYSFLGVMSAHVGVKERYEGIPCSLNSDCIGDLNDFFSQALIFTDALDMSSAGHIAESEELMPLAERSVLAVMAGNDILVFGPNVKLIDIEKVFSALETAYQADEKFQQQVEKSVEKILQYKAFLRQ